jgi:surface antigen
MKLASKLIGLAFAILVLTATAPVVRAEGDTAATTPCSQNKEIGCVLTTIDGVNVYFNGMDPTADQGEGDYGYMWQCVELIQRYYAVRFNYPDIWAPLDAYEMFDDWGHPETMTAYPNGSSNAPREGDVLVFDPVWGNPYGHVALVKSVGDGKVTFVQQNVYDIGEDSLPIDSNNNITNEGIYGPVRGWLRDTATVRPLEQDNLIPSSQVLVNFTVHSDGKTQLILDGKQILSGEGDQTSDWTLLSAGKHTVELVGIGAVNAHLDWTTRLLDDMRISK